MVPELTLAVCRISGIAVEFDGIADDAKTFAISRGTRVSRIDYNEHRPQTSLRGLTPNEFAARSGSDHKENRVQL